MEDGREVWLRAIAIAEQLRKVDPVAATSAREEVARRDPAELSPTLLGFWLDLSEELVLQLHALAALLPEPTAAASSAPADLPRQAGEPPRELDGYRVLDELGRGAMGTVYRALDVALHREVALKVLRWHPTDTDGERRFLREARAAAAVTDPHVVTCYAVGQAEGCFYVAMELLSGGDAAHLAARAGGRLDVRRALGIARDACVGLEAIARAGLIHRDLKPSNLLLSADGVTKLGDFGLARSLLGDERITLSGVLVGTPAYMPPEQAAGGRLDIRADIYALGATLYELVSGQPPYSGPTLEVVRRKLSDAPGDRPTPLATLCPQLEPGVAALIETALARDPEHRYPTPRALRRALDALLARRSGALPERVTTRSAATVPRASARPRRPRPLPGWPLGLAVGLLLVAVALAVLLPDREAGVPAGGDAPPSDPGAQGTELPAGPEAPPGPEGSAQPEPEDPPAQTEDPPAAEPADPPAQPEPEDPPAAEPADPPVQPEPADLPAGPEPVAFTIGDPLLCRAVGPRYVLTLEDRDFSRVGLYDREARRLPLRVEWTVQGEVLRDAGAVASWEREQGFSVPAGLFFELGVRASPAPVSAGAELADGAFWVCLQLTRDGRVSGLLRSVNRDKPADERRLAVFPEQGRRTAGVAVLGALDLRRDPGLPLTVVMELHADGFSLAIQQADTVLHRLDERWEAHPPALTDELSGDVWLWGHAGHWSTGRGQGWLEARVRGP